MVQYLETKVDVIIVLAHISSEEATAIAEANPEIDLFITGHEHREIDRKVNGVHIVQSGSYFRNLGKVQMTVSKKTVTTQSSLIKKESTADLVKSAFMTGIITEIDEIYDEKASEVVATLTEAIDGSRGDTLGKPLGVVVAKTMRAAVPAADRGNTPVVAFTNSGGIRDSIDAGPLTYGEVIDVLPFGNTAQ